jgi:peptidoglycan hydrolase-like protein with peptidoglycan-binding domain
MANALPLLLLAGGAALLVLSAKKKVASGHTEATEPPPPTPKPGPSGSSASKEVWKERQYALAYLSGLGVCSCSPGKIDGVYGSKTKSALKSFQSYAGISQTGKWDAATNKAMSQALVEAVKGFLTPPPIQEPNAQTSTSYLRPNTWPSGKMIPPQGNEISGSWLPDNMLLIPPSRKYAVWFLALYGIGPHIQNGKFSKQDYLVRVSIPVSASKNQIVSNREDWIRHYYKVLTSVRNIATMYPKVNFSVLTKTVSSANPKGINVEFHEAGFSITGGGLREAPTASSDELAEINFSNLTPTPEMVESIVSTIEDVF